MSGALSRHAAGEGVPPDYDWRRMGPLGGGPGAGVASLNLPHLSSEQFGEGIAGETAEAAPSAAPAVAGVAEAAVALL